MGSLGVVVKEGRGRLLRKNYSASNVFQRRLVRSDGALAVQDNGRYSVGEVASDLLGAEA